MRRDSIVPCVILNVVGLSVCLLVPVAMPYNAGSLIAVFGLGWGACGLVDAVLSYLLEK